MSMTRILCIALLLAVSGFAAEVRGDGPSTRPAEPRAVSAAIPMTRQLDFTAKANGRTYRLQVALPFAKAPAAGFPVIYVIDGDGYFGTWAFAARMRAMSDELEHAVVVGIGYPEAETDMMLAMQRRMSELVPSVDAEAVRTLSGSGTGTPLQAGADDLLRILREEVPPLVAGIVPIDRGRQTLFGHSLGGLFALHVLFSHPDAFQTYLVLSPSIWWDDRKVLSGRARFLERVKRGEVAPRVYLVVGSLEQPDPSMPLPGGIPPGMTESQARQLVARGAMVDNTLEMLRVLQVPEAKADYQVKGRVVPQERHISVAWAALNEMLDFAVSLRR